MYWTFAEEPVQLQRNSKHSFIMIKQFVFNRFLIKVNNSARIHSCASFSLVLLIETKCWESELEHKIASRRCEGVQKKRLAQSQGRSWSRLELWQSHHLNLTIVLDICAKQVPYSVITHFRVREVILITKGSKESNKHGRSLADSGWVSMSSAKKFISEKNQAVLEKFRSPEVLVKCTSCIKNAINAKTGIYCYI